MRRIGFQLTQSFRTYTCHPLDTWGVQIPIAEQAAGEVAGGLSVVTRLTIVVQSPYAFPTGNCGLDQRAKVDENFPSDVAKQTFAQRGVYDETEIGMAFRKALNHLTA